MPAESCQPVNVTGGNQQDSPQLLIDKHPIGPQVFDVSQPWRAYASRGCVVVRATKKTPRTTKFASPAGLLWLAMPIKTLPVLFLPLLSIQKGVGQEAGSVWVHQHPRCGHHRRPLAPHGSRTQHELDHAPPYCWAPARPCHHPIPNSSQSGPLAHAHPHHCAPARTRHHPMKDISQSGLRARAHPHR